MKKSNALSVAVLLSSMILLAGIAVAQVDSPNKATDPGVRAGAAIGATSGNPLPAALKGLSADQNTFFTQALARFQEVDSVSGALAGENGVGLGPRFNSRSCSGCHNAPAIGGSSPAVNPQVADATDAGATNTVPAFITANGPVREVRFVNNADGTADGGVHDLYTITGRTDAPGCVLTQPDFVTAVANNNAIFRIPTPTYGAGLIENTPDASLVATVSTPGVVITNALLGISGHFNHSGNDGTITRFGWKAQNKSLLIFSGEAYNVEQGVTNEAFPNEREDNPNCQFNGLPEDSTNMTGATASDFSSDIVNFAAFMRLSDAPAQANTSDPTVIHGEQVFDLIGCGNCHQRNQKTGRSTFQGQDNRAYAPRSDIQVHHMGTGLADRVGQGNAVGDEFRSAPLWGAGQRRFFLHDGRTSDLRAAIDAHEGNGSEANAVVEIFEFLSAADQQAVLNYLRSL